MNTVIYQVIMYCCVCFVVIDISHHTVLDPVSNMDGVLKPVPSINPDNMPTSCWQQIRKNLVPILCSAWVIAIIAVLCFFFYQHTVSILSIVSTDQIL